MAARVPFVFTLTGGSTKYGTPFVNADAAFTNAKRNEVLASILAASQVPGTYGLALPDGTKAYRITRIHIESELTSDDAQVAIWNGAAVVEPFAKVINGNGDVDFGQGITVPVGYIPAIVNTASSTATQFSGWIEWEKVGV